MDALANYDSDEEKDEKFGNLKDGAGKSNIAGDNYDNVQMDLSEENSSSSSKTGRDEVQPASTQHSDRSCSVREDRRRDREQPERRQHGRDRRRSRSPTHHSSGRHHGGGRDRHRTDERRGHSKRSPPRRRSRSRSPSRRSPGRGSRREHRRRSKSRSPGPSTSRSARAEASSSNTGREKSGSISPPSLTSEQYLASLSLAQKLAQQVQPNAQKAGLLGATPGMNRIQEQLQRRRMLWQQNKVMEPKDVPGPSNNNWEGALLPKDQDGTMTAKFKRLMGMKGAATEAATAAAVSSTETAQQQLKKTDDMLQDMERQYEVARLATHTHRGLGLGFGAFQCNYPR